MADLTLLMTKEISVCHLLASIDLLRVTLLFVWVFVTCMHMWCECVRMQKGVKNKWEIERDEEWLLAIAAYLKSHRIKSICMYACVLEVHSATVQFVTVEEIWLALCTRMCACDICIQKIRLFTQTNHWILHFKTPYNSLANEFTQHRIYRFWFHIYLSVWLACTHDTGTIHYSVYLGILIMIYTVHYELDLPKLGISVVVSQ